MKLVIVITVWAFVYNSFIAYLIHKDNKASSKVKKEGKDPKNTSSKGYKKPRNGRSK